MSFRLFNTLIAVLSLFLFLSCGGDENERTLRFQIALPADWESLIDMEVLGSPVSTPYVGTIRIVVEDGAEVSTWEFPWDDKAGSTGNFSLTEGSVLRVEAVTAGTVIMERDLPAVGDSEMTITLKESGGFAAAGSLLHYRQDHSAVAVGDTVMIIGGTLSTRVIEEIASSGDEFAVSAYAASLVYPRTGQKVLHDETGGRLFVFKGRNSEEDNFFELIHTTNKSSSLVSLNSYRKEFNPVSYDQNIFLLGGYNQNENWLIDTLVLNEASLSETIEPLLGISTEKENHVCINNGFNLICTGGSLGINYFSSIHRFDLDKRINLTETSLNSPKEYFSSTRLNNDKVLITGGIGDTGYLNDVEIIDLLNGNAALIGTGLNKARANHVAVQIDNKHVLILGGWESAQISRSAEILDLTTGQSTELPWRMRVSRVGHSATLLPDGRVLVVGGNMGDRTVEVWNPPAWITN